MSAQLIDVNGRMAAVIEAGSGAPLVYLHGYADVHGVAGEFMPFHNKLAEHARVIAPAHPGCSGTDDLSDGHAIEDTVFHYLLVFDALKLDRFDLVGHSAGGWIAAEIAVRHREKIRSLSLIGACGLFVTGHQIADIFMHTQPERGVDYATL
ncbi:MAG: alpha/beta fold hydrolase, partial [Alphaproteobacteria bacterium]|nr:alpha/beta fold hydrolase [Alphaproteobacteria bacterium]